ncbi:MAG TPA: ComF family protein [Paludibacter sp.]|nr:ComF family protein [Paludibacter sp.]
MSFFTDLLNLVYPDLCTVCNANLMKHENLVCLSCLNGIPKTNFHLQADNPLERRFWGKVSISRGTAFFFFQKGSPFQKLLHALKYKGNKEIGELMGKYAAADLLESPHFAGIDYIIPVPLHPEKFRKRGYNQSEWIGRGLSQILGKPQHTTNLVRIQKNTTQTKKSVFERYENTDGIFKLLDNKLFEGKHILLVDDVLTTGSTLEACIKVLLETNGIKVSVFTLAIA